MFPFEQNLVDFIRAMGANGLTLFAILGIALLALIKTALGYIGMILGAFLLMGSFYLLSVCVGGFVDLVTALPKAFLGERHPSISHLEVAGMIGFFLILGYFICHR